MRTGLSACGIAPHIAELVIGHAKRGDIATYDWFEFGDEIKRALEAWQARLLRIIDGDANHTGDNVITLGVKT